jgi:hypothetical protein
MNKGNSHKTTNGDDWSAERWHCQKTWSYSLRVKSATKQKLENKYHPEGEMWND